MPARESKCRACNSPHRADIDERLIAGTPSRKVEKWLKSTHQVEISHAALAAHRRQHIQVVAETQARIAAEGAATLETAVRKRVADVHMLDDIASLAMDVAERLRPMMVEPSMAQATAFTASLKEAREAVVKRDEILRPDKGKTESNDPAVFRVELSFPERPPLPEPAACPPPTSGPSNPPTDEPTPG